MRRVCGPIVRVLCCVLCVAVVTIPTAAHAGELRVLDSLGLVRASRVVKDRARIVIALQPGEGSSLGGGHPQGSCSLSNLDGVAKEQQVTPNANGVCEFKDVASGAWEVGVPNGAGWSVVINE